MTAATTNDKRRQSLLREKDRIEQRQERRKNDLRCTVIAVRRTLASVNFENGEKWQWPIDELMAADGVQGFYLGAK